MANFDEMSMLFAIHNVEEQENYLDNVNYERQTRNKDNIIDPFLLPDRLFVKNFRLTKDVVRHLFNLLSPHIVSKSFRSSSIDLNTKVSTILI